MNAIVASKEDNASWIRIRARQDGKSKSGIIAEGEENLSVLTWQQQVPTKMQSELNLKKIAFRGILC